MDEKREIRSVECQLAIREAAQDAQSESRTITGTAIVFNRESQELDDWGERFKEIILPEACSMAFLNTQDVKLNLLHERELTIARCNKGDANASLRLSVDANGVNFEFDAPRCDLGDRALELVRTGVYSGCSFEFRPKDYEKKVEGDSVTIIHRSFERLGAITLGMDPAYTQTSVNVRELINGQPQKTEEEIQREKAEQEQQQREQAERDAEQRALRAYERRQRALMIESFD
jgi:HK97 family phage prohead protease